MTSTEGNGTRFTCPDCGGVLFEEEQGALLRFRCSVGHAFSVESLEASRRPRSRTRCGPRSGCSRTGSSCSPASPTGPGRPGAPARARVFDAQAREAARRSHVVRGAIDRGAPALGEAS